MKNKKHKETKGMKKILVMVLVGVIGMCIFTGCGKSEEEKAMDEIADHLRDEAAADGVDIDKMVEEEAEKYNAELEAGNKTIANENEFKEENMFIIRDMMMTGIIYHIISFIVLYIVKR